MTLNEITCPLIIQGHLGPTRCTSHTAFDGFCLVHGNVVEELKLYRKTGRLTHLSDQLMALQTNKPGQTVTLISKSVSRWKKATRAISICKSAIRSIFD